MWLDGLVELLSPVRCAACDAPGSVLCPECAAALPVISRGSACPICGAPVTDPASGCRECAGRQFAFSASRSVGLFAPPLSDVVKVYKDAGERRLAPVIAGLMADTAGEWLRWAEVVTAVPPRPSSVATRGFDHMRLVALAVCAASGPSFQSLLCSRDSRDQRALGRTERLQNTRHSYVPRTGRNVPSNILLLDDVFTTGATLTACAAVLRKAGAREVRCLTFARATDVAES